MPEQQRFKIDPVLVSQSTILANKSVLPIVQMTGKTMPFFWSTVSDHIPGFGHDFQQFSLLVKEVMACRKWVASLHIAEKH